MIVMVFVKLLNILQKQTFSTLAPPGGGGAIDENNRFFRERIFTERLAVEHVRARIARMSFCARRNPPVVFFDLQVCL